MLETKAVAAALAPIVKEHVAAATAPLVARIEELERRAPEKGKPGDPGRPGDNGKDGVGLAGALIDRTGALVVTLSDGTTRELGPVVGKDGDIGESGKDGLDGKDGKDGKDGIDGIGFDDLTFDHDGERGFTLRFARGDVVKEFSFAVPVVIDRGVWKEREEPYQKGDAVSWAGSLWIAQRETQAKPDGGDDWRLAVKRGRDGKDKA